ncbi:hypothetical protein TNCV_1248091 [Trichonephila clavipes]|nr:hypothetical protein TNCV_1248091 [Trichonephila clavipes]
MEDPVTLAVNNARGFEMSNHSSSTRAVSSLVVRASDSRPEALGSMLDATKYPLSTHGVRALPYLNCGGRDRWCRHLSSLGEFRRANSYCHLYGAKRTPCHDEIRGSRSDCVRQVVLATTTTL